MELKKNHALQGGKYRIIEKIGQGGFAITYKANWSTEVTGPMGKIATDVTVAVKEFFFADYCTRDNDTSHITISSPTGGQIFDKFKEKLKKEAAILSRLRHPNIVSVLDIFEENNTVYMVMEYISGGSLKDVIRKNGKLDEATTLRYASQLCDAVAEIHRNNVLHLDIKPGNILIDPNDNVRLIDFGISKQYNSDTHAETSTTPVGISKGFAPTEQYTGVAQFSPATDIYAIGATIYNMCSGKIPPEAVSLLDEDLPKINGISDQLWNAITKAMSVRRNQRPQSAAELMNLLPSANAAKNAPAQQPAQQPASAYEKTQIVNQEPAPKPTHQAAQQPAATYEKTQIVDQEPASAPAPQPAQPKTPVASNDKTMFESAAHQATYAPAQNASASTSSDDYVDFDSYSDDDDDSQLRGKWCVKSIIAKVIFGLSFVSAAFALIYYHWLNHGDGVTFTDVDHFLWATLTGMLLTSFYVSFIARKEYKRFSSLQWWIRLILFLSLATISFVIWLYIADNIYLRDAQFITLNILSIIILICHNIWLKRNKKTILAGTILGYIGYSLCFIGALDNSETIMEMGYVNGVDSTIFCMLSTDSTKIDEYTELYSITSKYIGDDSTGVPMHTYKLVKSRKIGNWEFFDMIDRSYKEEVSSEEFKSIYYEVSPDEIGDNIYKVTIWGATDSGMGQIAEGYIRDSIQNQYWYCLSLNYYTTSITQGKEIDLGLPSGTIWAGWNVGAESAEQGGEYYAFGETETKEIFTDDNFIGYGNVPSSISGTQYDVARKKWGEDWRIPTRSEFDEIIKHCTWISTNYLGIRGYKATGPNGNCIFFPTEDVSGHYTNDIDVYNESRLLPGTYLSGESCNELGFADDGPWIHGGCCGGKWIRPVKSK